MAETERRIVQLESPFGAPDADGVVRNVAYALQCMRHSLEEEGEAPFASHLLYTQMLDDTVPHERTMGIKAGLVIGELAELTVVYEDLGISRGMEYGIQHAEELGRPVEYRRLFPANLPLIALHEQVLAGTPLDLTVIRALYARGM